MGATVLSTHAQEKSAYLVSVSFVDPAGDAINTEDLTGVTWTLTDAQGTVINEQEAVAVETPASPQLILLSGDDLALLPAEANLASARRILTVSASYTSDLAESDLTLNQEFQFEVDNLQNIT